MVVHRGRNVFDAWIACKGVGFLSRKCTSSSPSVAAVVKWLRNERIVVMHSGAFREPCAGVSGRSLANVGVDSSQKAALNTQFFYSVVPPRSFATSAVAPVRAQSSALSYGLSPALLRLRSMCIRSSALTDKASSSAANNPTAVTSAAAPSGRISTAASSPSGTASSTASAGRKLSKGSPRRTIFESLRSDLVLFLKVSALVYVFFEYIASLTVCVGPSMEPVIHASGDVVLIDKLHTARFGVRKGDIVVLRSPVDHRVDVCKRVVAVEGEPVPGRSGQFVGKGMLWVEGDNKHNSTDSRSYGQVPQALVLGRVKYRVYPWRYVGALE